jgi:mannose/fructose/N-acetylgalactosamine-specific phosphotransferase system component IIB
MKLNVYWTDAIHYNAEIVVDDDLSEDEIHERLYTIISRDIIGEMIGSELESDSIDWDEIT